jgi:hypothetical protein
LDNLTTMTVIEKADLDAKIAELTKERDIARAMYCRIAARHDRTGDTGHLDSAESLGWDCFAKEGKA